MGDLKPLPEGAQDLESIGTFLKICREKAPQGSVSIDPKNVMVANRDDKKVELHYRDPSKSFFCDSKIDFQNHEMRVDIRLPGGETVKPPSFIEMTDGCKVAKVLDVEGDLPGQMCVNGVLDNRLKGADKYSSFQDFENTCKKALSDYSAARFQKEPNKPFKIQRVHLDNPFVGDGTYDFLYESLGNNYFCDAMVDSNQHSMIFRSGPLREKNTALPYKVLPMTDACSMTEGLLGKDELPGDCNDMKTSERNWGNILGIGFTGVMSVLFYRWLWKSGVKAWGSRPLLALRGSTILQSLGRGVPTGYLAGKLFDEGVGIFIKDENHPLRAYGKWGAGALGVGAHLYLSRTLATRLAASSLAARAGGMFLRLGKGALLVGLVDITADSVFFKDYEKSVNERVADRVYKKHVYKLDGWDLLALPLALKGIRAGARFLAPTMMNWAITADNKVIKSEILEEDRKNTEQNLMIMQSLFAIDDSHKPTAEERAAFKDHLLKNLQTAAAPLQEKDEEILAEMAKAIDPKNPKKMDEAKLDEVRAKYGDLVVSQAQDRYTANKLQGAARFMVAVDQDYETNVWARDVFTEEGLLKPGQEKVFFDKVAPGL